MNLKRFIPDPDPVLIQYLPGLTLEQRQKSLTLVTSEDSYYILYYFINPHLPEQIRLNYLNIPGFFFKKFDRIDPV